MVKKMGPDLRDQASWLLRLQKQIYEVSVNAEGDDEFAPKA